MTNKALCEPILEQSLRRINRRKEARQLFAMWPTLHDAALRLCYYLSPYLEVNEHPLLDVALERGFEAAITRFGHEQIAAFIGEVISVSAELCKLQISIQDKDGDWEIWDFDRPILEWMGQYQREYLQIRTRPSPFAVAQLRLALLRQFSMRDIMQTNLELSVVL